MSSQYIVTTALYEHTTGVLPIQDKLYVHFLRLREEDQSPQPIIANFINERCSATFRENNVEMKDIIIFVEQNEPAQLFAAAGNLVTSGYIPNYGQCKRDGSIRNFTDAQLVASGLLRPYCSLGCICVDFNHDFYALTTGHSFLGAGEVYCNRGRTDVFCDEIDLDRNQADFNMISQQLFCVRGNYTVSPGHGVKSLDFALIHVEEVPNTPAINKLCHSVPSRVADVSRYSFNGVMVTKIGAATGCTTGVIILSDTSFSGMDHVIAVRCPDSSQHFADHGDSGALVVGRNGPHDTDPVAIGLVVGGAFVADHPNAELLHTTFVLPICDVFRFSATTLRLALYLPSKWRSCPLVPQ